MIFMVRRLLGQSLVKTYGPFHDRDSAERVAQRACEKHPDCVVSVEPVTLRPYQEAAVGYLKGERTVLTDTRFGKIGK